MFYLISQVGPTIVHYNKKIYRHPTIITSRLTLIEQTYITLLDLFKFLALEVGRCIFMLLLMWEMDNLLLIYPIPTTFQENENFFIASKNNSSTTYS